MRGHTASRCLAAAIAIALALALLVPLPLRATPDGTLDSSFANGGGLVFNFPAGEQVDVHAIRTSLAGMLTVAARLHHGSTSTDFRYCSLTEDGSSSSCTGTTFGFQDPHWDAAMAVAFQLDGEPVLAGYASGTAADPGLRLAFDGPFGTKTINFAGDAEAVAISARRNGDFLFTGNYDHEVSAPGTGLDCVVGRMEAGGTLDDTFSDNGLATIGWNLGAQNSDECVGEALYRDGRMVVAARVERADSSHEFGIARLTSDGVLDSNFSNNGKRLLAFDLVDTGATADVGAIALDHRARILVAGEASTGTGWEAALARLLPDGTLDPSFHGNGRLVLPLVPGEQYVAVTALRILPPPSNDIVLAGALVVSDHEEGFVAVLHDDGSLDGSFGTNGLIVIDLAPGYPNRVAALTVQGGKLVVATDYAYAIDGESNVGSFIVLRLYMNRIFGDDFEGGDRQLWSNFADP